MSETERQEKTVSELIVTEAVKKGLDTPLRDSILEGVDAAGEQKSTGRRLPLAGALFGLGAAIGFLAGRETNDMDEMSLEDVQEPEIIEDVVGEMGDDEEPEMERDAEAETETDAETESSPSRFPKLLLVVGEMGDEEPEVERDAEDETETEAETESSSSRLPKLLLVVGVIAGAVLLRRRLGGSEQGEWEPIEEFEPATTDSEEETETASMDESDHDDEHEEFEADSGEVPDEQASDEET